MTFRPLLLPNLASEIQLTAGNNSVLRITLFSASKSSYGIFFLGDDPPIGAIVGGICGAILIVAVLLGVFCYRLVHEVTPTCTAVIHLIGT